MYQPILPDNRGQPPVGCPILRPGLLEITVNLRAGFNVDSQKIF
jgi:hypothetical protein